MGLKGFEVDLEFEAWTVRHWGAWGSGRGKGKGERQMIWVLVVMEMRWYDDR